MIAVVRYPLDPPHSVHRAERDVLGRRFPFGNDNARFDREAIGATGRGFDPDFVGARRKREAVAAIGASRGVATRVISTMGSNERARNRAFLAGDDPGERSLAECGCA